MKNRSKKRNGGLERLHGLLSQVYPAKEPAEVAAIRAFGWWDRVVPARVAKNARPVQFAFGVLTIHTTNSVWAADLDYLKDQLLSSVQKNAPLANVKALKFRVGPIPKIAERPLREGPAEVSVLPLTELPHDLARALACLHDDELRTAITRAAATSLAPAPVAPRSSSPRVAEPRPRLDRK